MKKSMLKKRLTRYQFHDLLGGGFTPDKQNPRLMTNGTWTTWSVNVKGRKVRFAQTGKLRVSGFKWIDIAKRIGVKA